MDIYDDPDFYSDGKDLKSRNPNGLKHYSKFDRNLIFENQTTFCKKQGVLITDIVRQIEPTSFDKIYDNFPDSAIENAASSWNTKGILLAIEKYNPKRILINFKLGQTIPRISDEITKIKNKHETKVFHMLSTSGAAGNNYKTLFEHWNNVLNKS